MAASTPPAVPTAGGGGSRRTTVPAYSGSNKAALNFAADGQEDLAYVLVHTEPLAQVQAAVEFCSRIVVHWRQEQDPLLMSGAGFKAGSSSASLDSA